MVKRFCIMFPDAAVSIMSNEGGEAAALGRARRECKLLNKNERDAAQRATFGEIEISLTSFKEKF